MLHVTINLNYTDKGGRVQQSRAEMKTQLNPFAENQSENWAWARGLTAALGTFPFKTWVGGPLLTVIWNSVPWGLDVDFTVLCTRAPGPGLISGLSLGGARLNTLAWGRCCVLAPAVPDADGECRLRELRAPWGGEPGLWEGWSRGLKRVHK